MSARAEKVVPARGAKPLETVVGFDAVRLKAPFLLRCGALLIDYILIVGAPVVSLLLARTMGADGRNLLGGSLGTAGWLIAFLMALTNFIIFPMLTGQSIGKMLTGLRVVKTDGTPPPLVNLLLRHLLGYPLTVLTLGLGFLFSVANSKGKALHDYLAGTVVVYGKRRRIRNS